MKQKNLKQLGCLLLVTALLAGCAPSERLQHVLAASDGDSFVVDGIAYDFISVNGQLPMHPKKDDWRIYSLTLVNPDDQRYSPAIMMDGGEIKGQIYWQDEPDTRCGRKMILTFGVTEPPGKTKVADVPLHFVYFIDDGKIVFQKSHAELGIDISDPKRGIEDRKLRPILETLIRENMPLKENDDRSTPTQDDPNEE